jgi:hypothetical protein
VELNTLYKQLLAVKKTAHETFLGSVGPLSNKDNCWSEFYKYVKMHKGNRENIPAIKDSNGTIITDSTEKPNILNSHYASVFSCDRNITNIKSAHWDKTFTINTKLTRKRVAAIGRRKSLGPDSIPGEILKLGGEAMIPFLARLLEITLNNATIQVTGEKPLWFLFTKGVTDR